MTWRFPSAAQSQTTHRDTSNKPGKDGKRRNNKATQTVSAKPQILPRSEPRSEFTSSMHRIGRAENPQRRARVTLSKTDICWDFTSNNTLNMSDSMLNSNQTSFFQVGGYYLKSYVLLLLSTMHLELLDSRGVKINVVTWSFDPMEVYVNELKFWHSDLLLPLRKWII